MLTEQQDLNFLQDTPRRMFEAFGHAMAQVGVPGHLKRDSGGTLLALYRTESARILVTSRVFTYDDEGGGYHVEMRLRVNSDNPQPLIALLQSVMPTAFYRFGAMGETVQLESQDNLISFALQVPFPYQMEAMQAVGVSIASSIAQDLGEALRGVPSQSAPAVENNLSEMRRLSGYGYRQTDFRTSPFEAGWAKPVGDFTPLEEMILDGALVREQHRAASQQLLSGNFPKKA